MIMGVMTSCDLVARIQQSYLLLKHSSTSALYAGLAHRGFLPSYDLLPLKSQEPPAKGLPCSEYVPCKLNVTVH